ncbi:hypothetical protein GCM10025868_17470 [Angustibacter aerolatus]|uniref:Amidinotransferase n=1 Tax=Angustibacter aerolatus TaxID=1162965 RepID=A0ABQ6JFC6_9ACTN|nr:hypothetical protein GCM10025868_17470 [Angustibacter aerolatus]
MCRPTYFDVEYAINPWMDPTLAVDRELALRQWQGLVDAYRALGHEVRVVEGVEGLPDMVFVADSGLVVDGVGVGARYLSPMRQAEAPAVQAWLRDQGVVDLHMPTFVNEGEGDFLVVGGLVLAGTGFRTDLAAHHEAQEHLGVPVVSLQARRRPHLPPQHRARRPRRPHRGVLPARVQRRQPAGARAALPGRRDRHRRGRLVARPQPGERRPQRRPPRPGDPPRRRACACAATTQSPWTCPSLRKSGGSAKCCTLEPHRSTR